MNKTEEVSKKAIKQSLELNSNPVFYFFLSVLILYTAGFSLPYEPQLLKITQIVSWVYIVILFGFLVMSVVLHFILQKIQEKLIQKGERTIRLTKEESSERKNGKHLIPPPAIYALFLSSIDPIGGFCLIIVYIAILNKSQEVTISIRSTKPVEPENSGKNLKSLY